MRSNLDNAASPLILVIVNFSERSKTLPRLVCTQVYPSTCAGKGAKTHDVARDV